MPDYQINAIINPRGAQAGSRQVRQSLANIDRSTLRTSELLRQTFVGGLAFAGIAGFASGISSLVRTIASFEQAMSGVRAITQATGNDFRELTNRARNLGATTRFTATQAAEGMLFLARAGFNTNQVLGAIEGTLRLAQAGSLDLGRAADIASNILTGFRLNVDQTGQVVDVLAFAANNANTSVEQLGDGMKFVAPIAAGLNVTLEESASAMAALSNAGLQASLAGTGLRRVLSELESPAAKTQRILAAVGLTADDVRVSQVGLVTAIQRLRDAGIDAGLALEIFGDRGGPAFEVLQNSLPSIIAMNDNMLTLDEYARGVAQVMDDNLNGALLAVGSAAESVVLSIGELGASNALTQGLDALTVTLRSLAANMEAVTSIALAFAVVLTIRLLRPLALAAAAFLRVALQGRAMTRQLTFIRGAATGAAASIVATTTAATALRGVMAFLGGPVGLISLAAIAIYELSNNGREAEDSIEGLNQWMATFNSTLRDTTDAADESTRAIQTQAAAARDAVLQGQGLFDRSPEQLETAGQRGDAGAIGELQGRRLGFLGGVDLELQTREQQLVEATRGEQAAQQRLSRNRLRLRELQTRLNERIAEGGDTPTEQQRQFITQDQATIQSVDRRIAAERQGLQDAATIVREQRELVDALGNERRSAIEGLTRAIGLGFQERDPAVADPLGEQGFDGAPDQFDNLRRQSEDTQQALVTQLARFRARSRQFGADLESAGAVQFDELVITGERVDPSGGRARQSPDDRAEEGIRRRLAASQGRGGLEFELTEGRLRSLTDARKDELRALEDQAIAADILSEVQGRQRAGTEARRDQEVNALVQTQERLSALRNEAREVTLGSSLSEQDQISRRYQEQIDEAGRLGRQRGVDERDVSNAILELRRAEATELNAIAAVSAEESSRDAQERAQDHATALKAVQERLIEVGLATRTAADEATIWGDRIRTSLDLTTEEGRVANEAIEQIIERQRSLDSGNILAGLQIGIERFTASARSNAEAAADFMMNAIQGAADSMADSLARFVETGKISFGDLVNSLVADLTRLAANQIFTQLFGAALGAFSPGVNVSGGQQAFASGFASGGRVRGSGGTDTVPAYLTPGEYVVNPRATAAAYPFLESLNNGVRGFGNGGIVPFEDGALRFQNGGQVPFTPAGRGDDGGELKFEFFDQRTVQSNEDSGNLSVQQSQGPNGQQNIRVFLRNSTRGDISNGTYDEAFERRYGIQPRRLRG